MWPSADAFGQPAASRAVEDEPRQRLELRTTSSASQTVTQDPAEVDREVTVAGEEEWILESVVHSSGQRSDLHSCQACGGTERFYLLISSHELKTAPRSQRSLSLADSDTKSVPGSVRCSVGEDSNGQLVRGTTSIE